jgi:hypothetical protein
MQLSPFTFFRLYITNKESLLIFFAHVLSLNLSQDLVQVRCLDVSRRKAPPTTPLR